MSIIRTEAEQQYNVTFLDASKAFDRLNYWLSFDKLDKKYVHVQWCSGKFSLVGTLAWHYGHLPYRYRGGGGGGARVNGHVSKEKIRVQTWGYIF